LKHTALDRLQVRLNVILFAQKYRTFDLQNKLCRSLLFVFARVYDEEVIFACLLLTF